MEPKTRYRILVFSICVILLMFGIVIGFNIEREDNSNFSKEVINKDDVDEVSIYTDSKSAKKYDIELVYEDYYTLCNHSITSTDTIYATNIETLKKQEI